MGNKSSSSSKKNPYQRPEMIHRFWNSGLAYYSPETKAYYEACALSFIASEGNGKKVNWIKK